MSVEEFLDMPAFWEMEGEVLDRARVARCQEGLELIVVGFLSDPLDELEEGGLAIFQGVGDLGGGQPGPLRLEWVSGDLLEDFELGAVVGHGDQQVKRGVLADMVKQS